MKIQALNNYNYTNKVHSQSKNTSFGRMRISVAQDILRGLNVGVSKNEAGLLDISHFDSEDALALLKLPFASKDLQSKVISDILAHVGNVQFSLRLLGLNAQAKKLGAAGGIELSGANFLTPELTKAINLDITGKSNIIAPKLQRVTNATVLDGSTIAAANSVKISNPHISQDSKIITP